MQLGLGGRESDGVTVTLVAEGCCSRLLDSTSQRVGELQGQAQYIEHQKETWGLGKGQNSRGRVVVVSQAKWAQKPLRSAAAGLGAPGFRRGG